MATSGKYVTDSIPAPAKSIPSWLILLCCMTPKHGLAMVSLLWRFRFKGFPDSLQTTAHIVQGVRIDFEFREYVVSEMTLFDTITIYHYYTGG
jgi:hypothetical protein